MAGFIVRLTVLGLLAAVIPIAAQDATAYFDRVEVSIRHETNCGSGERDSTEAIRNFANAEASINYSSGAFTCPGLSINGTVNFQASGTPVPGGVSNADYVAQSPFRHRFANRSTFTRTANPAMATIQTLSLDNTAYTVGPPAPFTLAPNAIADVGVVFAPKAAGTIPAILRIVSNDPANGVISVQVVGIGQ